MSSPPPTSQLHDPSQPPPTPGRTAAAANHKGHHLSQDVLEGTPATQGSNAFSSERPLGVTPVSSGGVAIDGQPNLPEGHANVGDKIIGKTEKVIGKFTRNPDLHEKGELRETGGKAAAEGRARAAHD